MGRAFSLLHTLYPAHIQMKNFHEKENIYSENGGIMIQSQCIIYKGFVEGTGYHGKSVASNPDSLLR